MAAVGVLVISRDNSRDGQASNIEDHEMNFRTISLSAALLSFSVISSAQNGPPTQWGVPKIPLHKCGFFDDTEQAACSSGCNRVGSYWKVISMPYIKGDTLYPGIGQCVNE